MAKKENVETTEVVEETTAPVVEVAIEEPVVHTISFTDQMIDQLYGHGELRQVINKIIRDLKSL